MAQPQDAVFRFLDLPLEVRRLVYEHAMGTKKVISLNHDSTTPPNGASMVVTRDWHSRSRQKPVNLNLLRSNSQIRNEIRQEYRNFGTILFDLYNECVPHRTVHLTELQRPEPLPAKLLLRFISLRGPKRLILNFSSGPNPIWLHGRYHTDFDWDRQPGSRISRLIDLAARQLPNLESIRLEHFWKVVHNTPPHDPDLTARALNTVDWTWSTQVITALVLEIQDLKKLCVGRQLVYSETEIFGIPELFGRLLQTLASQADVAEAIERKKISIYVDWAPETKLSDRTSKYYLWNGIEPEDCTT